MKTLRFLGMVLLTIALCANFSSCSDDDENDDKKGNIDNYEQLLIGTWYDSYWDLTLTFSEDHSGLYNEEGDADLFNWKLYGNSIVYEFSKGDKMIETIEKLTRDELVTSAYDGDDGSYEKSTFKRVK